MMKFRLSPVVLGVGILGIGAALAVYWFLSVYGLGYRKSGDRMTYRTLDEARGFREWTLRGADPGSFKDLGHGDYAKDSGSVYWEGVRVEGALPASLVRLSPEYAKDAIHAYYKLWVLPDADPSTFVDIYPGWAKDKTHVYVNGQALQGICDPGTFHPLEPSGVWEVDGKCAYNAGRKLMNADPATFTAISPFLAADAINVYNNGVTMETLRPCSPKVFILLGDKDEVWARDHHCDNFNEERLHNANVK